MIAEHAKERAVLWDSCEQELLAFRGLLPQLQSSWDMPWSSTAYCFDVAELRGLGRVRERDRFRKESSIAARAHAFYGGQEPVFDEAEGT